MSGDGHHITAPPEDGRGAARAMQNALKDAGISPEQIDYVNAHGTSTPLGDAAETRAIKTVFKDRPRQEGRHQLHQEPARPQPRRQRRHRGDRRLAAVHRNMIPPTINLDNPDPECDLDYVPHKARERQASPIAMSNSFGFGGHNATLIVRKV